MPILKRSSNWQKSPHVTAGFNQAKYGGVFYNDTTTVTLANATFYSNSATTDGGAMFNDAAATTLDHLTAVGNAAEHWVAVLVARKDKMDLAVNIAIGSSAQIALFVAPVLVLLSFVFGEFPMALVFNGYELGGLIIAVLIANFLTQDGESNWFEGVQLLALYAVLGVVFFYA